MHRIERHLWIRSNWGIGWDASCPSGMRRAPCAARMARPSTRKNLLLPSSSRARKAGCTAPPRTRLSRLNSVCMNESFDIGWSSQVGKDLNKIKAFLLENASEEVARKVVHGLLNAVEPTRLQPERYPREPRLRKLGNFRFIKKWNFKIIYEFTGNQIIVTRIIHSRRDFKQFIRTFK